MKTSKLFKATLIMVAFSTLTACELSNEFEKTQEVRKSRKFDVVCMHNGKAYFHENITNLEYSYHNSQYGKNSEGKIVVFMNGCVATEK